MAHKKAGGSSRNGRDTAGRRLGVKLFGGEHRHSRQHHRPPARHQGGIRALASAWAATTRSSPMVAGTVTFRGTKGNKQTRVRGGAHWPPNKPKTPVISPGCTGHYKHQREKMGHHLLPFCIGSRTGKWRRDFETARLLLRPLRPDDADALAARDSMISPSPAMDGARSPSLSPERCAGSSWPVAAVQAAALAHSRRRTEISPRRS
jgi:hypothetical protein